MTQPHSQEGLVVTGLTVRYGGHVAVETVDLSAPLATVTGLIGPNGAGKTTTFDACTGLLSPSAGTVRFRGVDISDAPPHARAQLGMGRTFQRMELFSSLTVRQNVELGREAGLAGSRPWSHVRAPRREIQEIREAADHAVDKCGLRALADRPVPTLSTGQRRLVELARAMAANASLLLLDEPSSGLDHAETRDFGDVLVDLVERDRVGILLVEHDMSLVMRICRQILVLDFGRVIFEGTPAEVVASERVRRAYLGEVA